MTIHKQGQFIQNANMAVSARIFLHLFRRHSSTAAFPGAAAPWTHSLSFAATAPAVPAYRVLDRSGTVLDATNEPPLAASTLQKMYKDMRLLTIIDKILYESQRQGRISFYMTNSGEEAMQVGSAAALAAPDVVYAQYREAGVLVWRGFGLQNFVDQCYGNVGDGGKGRQMPIHYGSRDLNFVTISSPLGTQMPQAVGAAYALKGTGRVVVCYFGEGAASEGDAHAAFNFAATLEAPVVLFCRNNGYAISTPAREQYRGDGVAARGAAYGIATVRVDGNDALAVYNATKMAREYCVDQQKPVLIEALGYRVGHHSTSDDSSAYRNKDEVEFWAKNNPVDTFKLYLTKKNLWSEEQETEFVNSAKKEVMAAFAAGERKLKPKWTECFEDVYKYMPEHLRKQMNAMKSHVERHREHYPVDEFAS